MFGTLHTESLVAILAIGLIAGWLARLIVGGGGLLRDLVTGLIGAFVGAFILRAFGIVLPFHSVVISDIVMSTIGAVVVVVLARAIA